MSEIMAIGDRRNNAELVVDLHALGYLDDDTLDATYGLGRFWTLWRPAKLAAVDIDPSRTTIVADFRELPFNDGTFRSVVLDPPYKLNGTSTGKGVAASDVDYGVGGSYSSVADKHQMIFDGITECIRVLQRGGHLIVKCQDQVVSGAVHWQTRLFADHAEFHGCRLVDMLHVQGYRKQPPGRRQLHARRDYSTALVFAKRGVA
jgi:hypothetical protein